MKVKYIDQIFVVNLKSDKNKLSHVKELLKDYDYEVIDAIHGSNLDYEMIKKYRIKVNERPNVTACFLSHLKAWEQIDKYNRILIFEDDINVNFPIQDIFQKFINYYDTIKDEPDVFFLGKCLDDCTKMTYITDNIYQLTSPLCGHAYILNKKGVKKLISLINNHSVKDAFIREMIEKGKVTAQGFHPSLIFQDNLRFDTNLREKSNSLYNYNECDDRLLRKNEKSSSNNIAIVLAIVIILLIIIMISISR